MVTQNNIAQTICRKGYTKTIRPPAHYTNRLKKFQIRQYQYDDRNPKHYEEDHLIALSIGGNPTDVRNLWPEPRLSEWNADRKDELEFVLYRMVCAGDVPLARAQHEMASDWISAWQHDVKSRNGSQFRRVDWRYRQVSIDTVANEPALGRSHLVMTTRHHTSADQPCIAPHE